MATETTNYKLMKPDKTDFVNIPEHMNGNMDIIDQLISERIEKAMIAHDLTTKDVNKVLGADVGEAIAQLLTNLQNNKADKTAIPTSLPANGGTANNATNASNADKLDGYHADSFLKTNASCNKNWNWNGQAGQPSWLWGGNDAANMYVYNPSNFNVNYANGAGYANTSGTTNQLSVTSGAPASPFTGQLWIW
ncbi:MAG TPA: hypothetical protein VHQ24_13060 [Lachnospiraceae bacterium]|nr:hypothetical protein [Lachnospiraceae bacterium]